MKKAVAIQVLIQTILVIFIIVVLGCTVAICHVKEYQYPMRIIRIAAGLKNNTSMVFVGILIPLFIFILQISKESGRVKAISLIAIMCLTWSILFFPYKIEQVFNSDIEEKNRQTYNKDMGKYVSMAFSGNNLPVAEYPVKNTVVVREKDDTISTITCIDSKDSINSEDILDALVSRRHYKGTEIYGVVSFTFDEKQNLFPLLSVVSYTLQSNSETQIVIYYYGGEPCYYRKCTLNDKVIHSAEKETVFDDSFNKDAEVLGDMYMSEALDLWREYRDGREDD